MCPGCSTAQCSRNNVRLEPNARLKKMAMTGSSTSSPDALHLAGWASGARGVRPQAMRVYSPGLEGEEGEEGRADCLNESNLGWPLCQEKASLRGGGASCVWTRAAHAARPRGSLSGKCPLENNKIIQRPRPVLLLWTELQTRVCAHAHLSLSRQGGGNEADGGDGGLGGHPSWPTTALHYAGLNVSQGVWIIE